MENKIAASSSMHPMLWVAAISVTLLSFAGIASLTGLLPAKSTTAPAPAPVASISAPAPAYAPPAAVPAAAPEAPAAAVVPAPAAEPAAVPHVAQHKAPKKKVATHSPEKTASGMPPPAGAGVPPDYAPPPPVSSAPPATPCANCGEIKGIRQITREGQGTGLGAVAGGVLGGVLGNNVGNGNGRTLATIAGAIGGGFLGNKVEKTQRESAAYQISVRMEDGTTQVIESATAPSWRTGDQVRLVNGAIVGR